MASRKKPSTMQKPPTPDTPQKQVITATTLADLAPRRGTVIVQRPDDQDDLSIPYRELSYKRYWEIGRMVEDPPPHTGEMVDFTKNEKGEVKQVFSVDTLKYQQARADAENQRALMRLAEFIDLPIDGETLEARAETLQNTLPHDVMNALSAAMRQLTIGSEAKVEARAHSFQRNGNGHHGDLPAAGVVSRKALAEPE